MAAAEIPHPLGGPSSSSLPVILPLPPPPSLLLFDDDDVFGDFTFASDSGAAPPPDDEWGDFVSSPIGSRDSRPSSLFDPFSDPAPNGVGKAWERPNGALPLSLFGGEEAEENRSQEKADLIFGNGFSSSVSSGLGSKRDLKDLIVSLYGQAPPPVTDGASVIGADVVEEDLEWEFQVAFTSDAGVKNGEKLLGIPGHEQKADANGHGFEGGGCSFSSADNALQKFQEIPRTKRSSSPPIQRKSFVFQPLDEYPTSSTSSGASGKKGKSNSSKSDSHSGDAEEAICGP